jgi:diacylglycerol kinase family enzyme
MAKTLNSVPKNANILIGGGDGTIRTAAAILKKRSLPFGIIPLGTMNLFAKDLSLELDPFKLAERYKNSKTIKIDAATVNGELFLCNAMVGLPPVLARERERQRGNETLGRWMNFIHRAVRKFSSSRSMPLTIRHDGTTEQAMIKAAVIANNEYEDRGGLGVFLKKSLSEGKLAIYTIHPEGTFESLALLSRLALGAWKDSAGLEFFHTRKMTLDSSSPKIKILLDGEIYLLDTPLDFVIEPNALDIIVPVEN